MCFSSWDIIFFVTSVFRESEAVWVGPFRKNSKWNSCEIQGDILSVIEQEIDYKGVKLDNETLI